MPTITETDKDGFGHFHKVLIKDRKEWDDLCKLYPLHPPVPVSQQQWFTQKEKDDFAIGFAEWMAKSGIKTDYKKDGIIYFMKYENASHKSLGTAEELLKIYKETLVK